MEPDRVRLFNEWAGGYDRSVQAGQDFPFTGYDALLDGVVFLADARAGHQILDLGIGTGNLAKRFVDLGCRVSGIDFSSKMLALAREKVPEVRLAEADISGPWPAEFAGRYDRIVSAYAFHHFDLQQKVALLQRLGESHLTPGGLVVVGDICFPTEESLVEARARAGDRWDDSESYWVATEAIAASERVGLSVRHCQVSGCAAAFVFGSGGKP
jgi:putative AdoMet-dependent methyltransferase